MPKKKTYRVYWTMKLYKDVEAESAGRAAEICRENYYESGTFIEDSCEIYKVTKPSKNSYDVGKPNLLEKRKGVKHDSSTKRQKTTV